MFELQFRSYRDRTGRRHLRLCESGPVQKVPQLRPKARAQLMALIQKMLDPSQQPQGHAMVIFPRAVVIHGEHRTRNWTYYTRASCLGDPEKMTGVHSLTWPYPKPVIESHAVGGGMLGGSSSPIYGRIIHGWYVEDHGLPEVQALFRITEPEAIRKILNLEFYTVSIGSDVTAAYCSYCGQNLVEDGPCDHERGKPIEGKEVFWRIEEWHLEECSFVAVPSDALSPGGPARILEPDVGLSQAQLLIQTKEGFWDLTETGLERAELVPGNEPKLALLESEWSLLGSARSGHGPYLLGPIHWREEKTDAMNEEQMQAFLAGLTVQEWPNVPGPLQDQVRTYLADRPDRQASLTPELLAVIGQPGQLEPEPGPTADPTPADPTPAEEPAAGPASSGEADEDGPLTYGELYLLDHEDDQFGQEAPMSRRQRDRLPDSAFCGPNRTWPVPNCDYVRVARSFLGNPLRTKNLSASQKAQIRACINRKARAMGCDRERELAQGLEPGYALALTFPEAGLQVSLFDLLAEPSWLVQFLARTEQLNLPLPIQQQVQKRLALTLKSLEVHCHVPGLDLETDPEFPELPSLEVTAENYLQLVPILEVLTRLLEAEPSQLSLARANVSDASDPQLEQLRHERNRFQEQLEQFKQCQAGLERQLDQLRTQLATSESQVQQLRDQLVQQQLLVQETQHRGRSELVGFLLWHSQHPRARGRSLEEVQDEMARQHPAVLEYLLGDLLAAYKEGRASLGQPEPVPDPTLRAQAESQEQSSAAPVPDPKSDFDSLVEYYRNRVEQTLPQDDPGDKLPEYLKQLLSLLP
jgi:hypothetical protein